MSRAEKAKEYFLQGYACSQAVALAFSDMTGVDEETLAKATLPFGGGMGRLRLTCGAVSGMASVAGLLFATPRPDAGNKKEVYAVVQELCARFKAEYGSLICGELLADVKLPVQVGGEAEPRTQEYYKKRPCAEMVAYAAQIVEEYLQSKNLL